MNNLLPLLLDKISNPTGLEVESSFKDFHSKGLDYLCLKRTPEHTVKLYVLEGDVTNLPEAVNPHDHRYIFSTTVLRGSLCDFRFSSDKNGEVFNAFDYLTPLNGGGGFTFRGEERLSKYQDKVLEVGDNLTSNSEHVHTIRPLTDTTILLLEQFEDTVPLDVPTSCWVREGDPTPNTSGLYSKFSEGDYVDRLNNIKRKLNL